MTRLLPLIRFFLRQWLPVAALSSALMLGIAHAFETFGHMAPCHLCLQERQVYWVAMTVAAVAFATSLTPLGERIRRPASALLALIFLFSAGLAAYHAGVEWHWWPGPETCTPVAGGVSKANLMALLHGGHTDIVDCSKPAWVFLGLSMAGWNVLCSLKLAVWSGVAAAWRGPTA